MNTRLKPEKSDIVYSFFLSREHVPLHVVSFWELTPPELPDEDILDIRGNRGTLKYIADTWKKK